MFADIGLIYARLMEGRCQYDEVVKICESLLLTPLNPHTRKLINSIKARVSGAEKGGGQKPKTAAPNNAGVVLTNNFFSRKSFQFIL